MGKKSEDEKNKIPVPAGYSTQNSIWGSPFKWIPENVGDFIEGTFNGIRVVLAGTPEEFKLAEIMTADGPFTLGGYIPTMVLFEGIPKGQQVCVQYVGDVEIKGQPQPMKNYRLFQAD